MKAFLFSLFFLAVISKTNAQTTAWEKNPGSTAKVPSKKNHGSKEIFSILKNPSSSNIIIFYDNAEINAFGVEITNEYGQVIFHKSYTESRPTLIEEVDLKEAGRGVYYIEIISPDKSLMKKIVLN